jgi:hypothetical protein
MDLRRLDTEAGRALIVRAGKLLADDPSRAAVALRRFCDDSALASAALSQAQLRAAATGKFGADAAALFLTRDGLEQASRGVVARRRAGRLAATGVEAVADLCCGLGADAIALARHGLRVLAVDRDPATAELAAANATALGLSDLIEVRVADAMEVDLSGWPAMFADPARRHNGKRVFDPSRYSPPLPRLWEASRQIGQRVCKVGPGIDHAVVPPDAEAEWVSVSGDVVEATLWRGEVAQVARRASVIHGDSVIELTGDGDRRGEVGPVGPYLYEPDGAVIRAHLVAELAQRLDARLGHPDIAYLYADTLCDTALATAYRVAEVLPFHVKKIKGALRQRRIGRLTVKKRGADIDPERLRRELRPSGENTATLVVTRLAERHVALLCERV